MTADREGVRVSVKSETTGPLAHICGIVDAQAGLAKMAVKSLLLKKAEPAAQIASPEEKANNILHIPGSRLYGRYLSAVNCS